MKKGKIFTFLLLFLFQTLIFPVQIFAQSTEIEDLTIKIDELLKTVSSLQEKLNNINSQTNETYVDFKLYRNLKFGDYGVDVKNLQIFLNSDSRTKISDSGFGSSGNETQYFGELTKKAVIRFQNLYADEILYPINLKSGTGFVGDLTIQKINSINSNISLENKVEEQIIDQNQNILFQEYDELILSFPSKYEGIRGDKFLIEGVGFTKENNTVYFDDYKIENIKSFNGTNLEIIIPENAPFGKHVLYAENSKGVSTKDLFFIIKPENVDRPVILSSYPKEGPSGTEITIDGLNFTNSSNEIRSTYDIFENIKSGDGKTIKFNITTFQNTGFKGGLEFPITFYIINDNGVSEEFGEFLLKI